MAKQTQNHPEAPGAPGSQLPRGLGMYEPTTAITDFLLALLALYFARRLRQMPDGHQQARRAWGAGFVATALAALAGGLFHGFGPDLPQFPRTLLWKLTMIGTGLTSFFMLLGTVYASAGRRVRPFAIVLVGLKSLVYARWLMRENDFRYVVYDYSSTMLVVLVVQLREYRSRNAARRIAQGIGVSFLAALIQQVGLNLHTHFNKNDLYHVVQAVGFVLFYRGARRLHDRD